jgi:xylulokinase
VSLWFHSAPSIAALDNSSTVSLFVGFDCSTQSLTATVIEVDSSTRRIALQRAIDFDRELPHYDTNHGTLRAPSNPDVVVAPPLMWAEALDLAMHRIAEGLGPDIGRVRAIAGSGQQHGSVYLNAHAGSVLRAVQPEHPIAAQLRGMFSRAESPIWMDSSTAKQCADITRTLGGPLAVAELTGSRAFERFTGPQIRKFFEEAPQAYEATTRIHLVSSFLASLLAGAEAPIDHGDGSGMNLMDIRRRRWAPAAVDATAPGLQSRLPPLSESWLRVGALAPYWRDRYGLPAADVIAWSGDNPCSLVGTGLVREGRVAISLGTSDTVFGLMREPQVDRSGAGSVFASPTGAYMGLTCFSNGSLARERVRTRFGLTWDQFSDALRRTPPGNHGALMLPWFEPEITPPVMHPRLCRVGLDENDAAANVRAVVEAQALAIKRHSAWTGVRVETIHATGGASANREILRVLADVFGAPVFQFQATNSAALGAALRAWHAHALANGEAISWDDVIAGFAEPIAESRIDPVPENVRVYREMGERHAVLERRELARES